MKKIVPFYYRITSALDHYGKDIPLLAIRIILAYAFFGPAMMKWADMESTIMWFGNEEWGLGLPFPEINAYMAATIEIVGVYLILFGLGTRIIAVPLIFVMLMALVTVHWEHGWLAIANSANDPEVAERLTAAKGILKQNGDYSWLTEKGNFVILNNGVEFVITYIVMLLILITKGAGRLSLDFVIDKFVTKR